MTLLAYVVLLGWIAVAIGLFAVLPPRRAALVAFIGGYLFLPMASIPIAGLPDFTKVTAVGVGTLLGAALFDPSRFFSLRPRWLDLPMCLWCLIPFVSGMSNGFDLYASFAAAFAQTMNWGVPYLVGRLYLSDRDGLRELAVAVVIAGLVYVPLCLWESRMSAQLSQQLYGFGGSGGQKGYGLWGPLGYAPKVFMANSLEVTAFMACTTVVGYWLWTTGTVRRFVGLPAAWAVPLLVFGTLLGKALGGIMLMVIGILALFLVKYLRSALPLACLVLAPILYVALRTPDIWSGKDLVSLVESTIDARRAGSLDSRLINESRLVRKALERPSLGWGPWGDYRMLDDNEGTVLTDGLWIITLGKYGLIGLSVLMLVFALPGIAVLLALPGAAWSRPPHAPLAALCAAEAIYAIDCLFNAFPNPILFLILGALAGTARAQARRSEIG